jgi:hypothetical protein
MVGRHYTVCEYNLSGNSNLKVPISIKSMPKNSRHFNQRTILNQDYKKMPFAVFDTSDCWQLITQCTNFLSKYEQGTGISVLVPK